MYLRTTVICTGVPSDLGAALKWGRLAAEQGHTGAMYAPFEAPFPIGATLLLKPLFLLGAAFLLKPLFLFGPLSY